MKDIAKQWLPFWIVAVSYVAMQMATDLLSWLTSIGREGFNNLEAYDVLLIALKLVVSGFIALRALQNKSYQETKERIPTGDTEIIKVKEQ